MSKKKGYKISIALSGDVLKAANEEPCGKPQGINSHITNTAAATLWQATGNPQVELRGKKEAEVGRVVSITEVVRMLC
jgi:hypothetical protein